MNSGKYKLYLFAKESFQFSLITYLLLFLAETLKPGFVSFFFNLNIILAVVILSGALMVMTDEGKETTKTPQKLTSAYIQNAFILAVVGSLLVYYKTMDIGTIAYLIAVLTGILIMFLSLLLVVGSE